MSDQGQQPQQQISANGKSYFGQDFYIYNVLFGTFTASATSIQNIQIQSDSDFEWIMTTAYGNMNGATAPFLETALLPINISMVDSGSSRQLFSAAVALSALAGSGKQPMILPVSRIFKAYSNIQITATSFDATNTYNNVSMNLIGRKLFLTSNR